MSTDRKMGEDFVLMVDRATDSRGSWQSMILVLGLLSKPALAAPAAQDSTLSLYGDPGVPDISGTWLGTVAVAPGEHTQTPVDERNKTTWAPWPAPLTPEYQKKTDEHIAATKAGRQLGDIGSRCLPFGVPRSRATPRES